MKKYNIENRIEAQKLCIDILKGKKFYAHFLCVG